MKQLLLTAIVSAVVSVGVTTAMTGIGMPAVASAQEARVLAQEFVLVGSDGSDRARLFELPNRAGARFSLLQGQAERVFLAYGLRGPEAAALGLRDIDGRFRILLSLATGLQRGTAGGLTTIAVMDRNDRVRLSLGVDHEGSPFIVLLDGAGEPTWNVGAPLKNILRGAP